VQSLAQSASPGVMREPPTAKVGTTYLSMFCSQSLQFVLISSDISTFGVSGCCSDCIVPEQHDDKPIYRSSSRSGCAYVLAGYCYTPGVGATQPICCTSNPNWQQQQCKAPFTSCPKSFDSTVGYCSCPGKRLVTWQMLCGCLPAASRATLESHHHPCVDGYWQCLLNAHPPACILIFCLLPTTLPCMQLGRSSAASLATPKATAAPQPTANRTRCATYPRARRLAHARLAGLAQRHVPL
jgi:hypothetical protein